jgi:hypothetical protein
MTAACRVFSRLALFVAVCAVPMTARAEDQAEKPWSIDTAVALNSDYMFRGQNLYDGISVQPSVGATYDTGFGQITGLLWMHTSAEGDRQAEKFFEMDEDLTYSYTWDPVTFTVGNYWYTYPDDSDDFNDTAEFLVGASLDDSELSPFPLNPTLTWYKDYREFETSYFELTFSHTVETDALGKGFATTPYVTFGFAANADKVYEDDGLEHVAVGTSFDLKVGDIALTPTVNYNFKVDDLTTNEFWVGLTFGYSI